MLRSCEIWITFFKIHTQHNHKQINRQKVRNVKEGSLQNDRVIPQKGVPSRSINPSHMKNEENNFGTTEDLLQ